jgi:hypothetical protein
MEGTMAGITKIDSDGDVRLYKTFSYRDTNNKPQHIRNSIGKIDNNTLKPVFNSYFINLANQQGLSFDLFYYIPKHINFCKLPNVIAHKT